jgi:hypothetical protein
VLEDFCLLGREHVVWWMFRRDPSFILKIEAAYPSEMSVNIYETPSVAFRREQLHIFRRENFSVTSQRLFFYFYFF